MGNPAVTTPFEPGSVNKVVTAAAAIENGIATPERCYRCPARIKVADQTVATRGRTAR